MRDQDNPEKARNCAQTITPAPSGLSAGAIALLMSMHDDSVMPTYDAHGCLNQLKHHELIAECSRPVSYALTARGRAFAEAIMALPLPVATWSMPK
jgi:hypothetical protein